MGDEITTTQILLLIAGVIGFCVVIVLSGRKLFYFYAKYSKIPIIRSMYYKQIVASEKLEIEHLKEIREISLEKLRILKENNDCR